MTKRPETTGRKIAAANSAAGKPEACDDDDDDDKPLSISRFCEKEGFSVATFYKFPELMPVTYYVATLRFIAPEERQRWRAARMQAAPADAAAAAAKRATKKREVAA